MVLVEGHVEDVDVSEEVVAGAVVKFERVDVVAVVLVVVDVEAVSEVDTTRKTAAMVVEEMVARVENAERTMMITMNGLRVATTTTTTTRRTTTTRGVTVVLKEDSAVTMSTTTTTAQSVHYAEKDSEGAE